MFLLLFQDRIASGGGEGEEEQWRKKDDYIFHILF